MSDSKKARSLEFAAYHMHAIGYPIEKAKIVRSGLHKELKEAKKARVPREAQNASCLRNHEN
ncbi:hypothetical protein MSSIH_2205 [Methanosarcina siciliae HI350]|uniref:Uncharacterized protein n=1 Tax=Methanosarcina siciliae HI350 TaxID=1434119 RepID=A0A0E3PEA3_9EURY|nr:hypothetical protein [Methanosarcina siciliae]AKB32895.1 hypothetical protein MSSIH_2205 [Methanosarcina siciliae HI350]